MSEKVEIDRADLKALYDAYKGGARYLHHDEHQRIAKALKPPKRYRLKFQVNGWTVTTRLVEIDQ